MRSTSPFAEPWLFQWARPIIVTLAIWGTLLTSYLTITHFLGGGPAFCASGSGTGCDLVLSSAYAKIFGIPLTIFGALGYLTAGAIAAVSLFDRRTDLKVKRILKQQMAFLLFLVSTAMLFFSGYLMYLLAFEIKTACLYCIGSAVTVATIWLLNLLGNEWEDSGQLFFTGLSIGLLVMIGAVGIYSTQGQLAAVNSSYAGQLAQHLTTTGAKMYGASWCPHCTEQKSLFGDAVKQIPYVECSPNGGYGSPPAQECIAKKIESYPTWEINGKLILGMQTLDELARNSNYQGPKN